MPYLKVQTNQPCDNSQTSAFLKEASQLVATVLGKPESYVMTALEASIPMLFAGTDEPAAYLELKSIGLEETQTPDLSKALCSLVEFHFKINQERIYIEFADAPRAMWGWNGGTF